jgi:hypothetical protein
MSRSRRDSPHNSSRSLRSPRTSPTAPDDSTNRHPAGTLTVISGGPAMVSSRAAPPGAGSSATEAVATSIERVTGRRLSRSPAPDRIDANHPCTHVVVRREPSTVKRRRLTWEASAQIDSDLREAIARRREHALVHQRDSPATLASLALTLGRSRDESPPSSRRERRIELVSTILGLNGDAPPGFSAPRYATRLRPIATTPRSTGVPY